jgi:perosamine synthetase
MYKEIIDFIKSLYPEQNPVGLHIPRFIGNEKEYLNNCIDTTFVSYIGEYVVKFEELIKVFTDIKYSVAVVNGTCALHVALILSDVTQNDEVITQPLTFIATLNAISYQKALPVFIDVDLDTMGLSAEKLNDFFKHETIIRDDGICYNKKTGNKIKACIPMHTFGHPARIDQIADICSKNNVVVIEDAAESLGSFYKNKHTGTFGKIGILSFNGNKTITAGGGGMILTNDEIIAKRAKHITTTAKIPHKWEFDHDETGYNYRMTNLNAAVGCAQMEKIDYYLKNKRELAGIYKNFFKKLNIDFFTEPENSMSNYWLNAVILKNIDERDDFLNKTNENGIMTRPIWKLMNKIEMFKNSLCFDIKNAEYLESRVVNIPSSVRINY